MCNDVKLCEVVWDAMRCCIMMCNAVRCLWGAVWCYVMMWDYVRWCEIMSGGVKCCEVVWCWVMWVYVMCYVMLCDAVRCCEVLCDAMWCYVMLWDAMRCCEMLWIQCRYTLPRSIHMMDWYHHVLTLQFYEYNQLLTQNWRNMYTIIFQIQPVTDNKDQWH